ncbi:hypothetical protein M9Y10_037978 [Tritrichomonas musculus]|uniref:Ubiquitin-like domain-containing protein n=1 Tax=Tritrichomonas musculus TaxID=1915356 RepID=A0ABR2K749_9EUKA
MTLTVKIIYAKDKSSTKIGSVPLTCTILKIKDILKQINKMSSSKSIRVVYRGRILPDDLSIGALIADEQQEITLYVSGIPPISSNPQNANTKQSKNNKPSGYDKTNDNHDHKKQGNLLCSKYLFLFIFLAVLFIFSFFLIKLVYFDPSKYGLPESDVKLNCSKEAVLYGILFFDLVVVLILIIIFAHIDFSALLKYIYLFFVSMLPIWDINEYRQNHGLEPI